MHPILYQFRLFGNEVTLGTYGLMAIAGIFAGISLTVLIGRRYGYSVDDTVNYGLMTVSGAIFGAFIVGFILFLPERIRFGFFTYPPALVSWGGILGSVVAVFIMNRKWRLSLPNFTDIASPGFLVGIGIGRIGCHFGGCCYGITTELPIGITFTDPIAPASFMQQPLLPVQLISAAELIIAGCVLIPFALKRKTPGYLFGASLIVYAVLRFSIEFFRSDSRVFLFGMSDGQLFSIAALICGTAGILYARKNAARFRERIALLHDPAGDASSRGDA